VLQEAFIAEVGGSTIVQIVGGGDTVVGGHPYLTLRRYIPRWRIRQYLDRLSPYSLSTPLLWRKAELVGLDAFLHDPRPIPARVITGGGGSEKTRLALEFCEKATTAGWSASLVERDERRRFYDGQNLSAWGWQKPALIVVDDAALSAELLQGWFNELSDRTVPTKQALRLLLLERNASTETGWWKTDFASGGCGTASKFAHLDLAQPVQLLPLARSHGGLTSRLSLFRT
jgi:hypothetical protein